MTPAPIVTLSNGIRVANFSSHHTFLFEDGTELPGCEEDRVKAGSVNPEESCETCETDSGAGYFEVTLTPKLTTTAETMLDEFYGLAVDIVIVPLMMLEAIKRERLRYDDNRWFFCHAIRRRERNGPICIDRFCV